MKVRMFVVASLTVIGLTASTIQAQVMQLGRIATDGRVAQASCECSGGGGLLGKMGFGGGCDGSCGTPSCGMAGEIIDSCCDSEPSCGYSGLGYGGGFGLCGGGDCGACGVGGYFGRNLHRVQPCACGGSLLGDLARGTIKLVDRTVGCVVGGVCGGLRTVSCHASGSFTALECAAQAGCQGCNGGGCDACGVADYGIAEYEYEEILNQPTPAASPQLTPAELLSGTVTHSWTIRRRLDLKLGVPAIQASNELVSCNRKAESEPPCSGP